MVSPSSRSQDRTVEPAKYADAGIRNFWRIEPRRFRGQLAGERLPVLFVYSLDDATSEYQLVHRLCAGAPVTVEQPFSATLDLAALLA